MAVSSLLPDRNASAPVRVGFGEALRFWFRLGLISFGGPAGQIAILHTELVERRRWISERRFFHALNYCMLLPGPEAQQLATYIGWLLHRTAGGIAAGSLFVLPSLVLLIVLSWLYAAFGHLPLVTGIFYGIKPAVIAIVAHAAHRIGRRALGNAWLRAIAAGAFLAVFALNLPFPLIVAAAALAGWIGGRLAPERFRAAHAQPSATGASAPALIDDDSPTPAHARFNRRRLAAVVLAGLALWAAPATALVTWGGLHGTYAQMAWFFTKAALLTFGGAYAVLPYVYQGAVTGYGWLSPSEMIDGLALGETTPGPLIMVVAFVGFLGGWHSNDLAALLGPDRRFAAAVIAACVVTWFTFLPSFLFILAGGPLVEATHGDLKFTAPLAAISAAVVGVIANLALFFSYHVLWPQGARGAFEWPAVPIAAAATVALFRYRRRVVEIIVACGAAGLAVQALRWSS